MSFPSFSSVISFKKLHFSSFLLKKKTWVLTILSLKSSCTYFLASFNGIIANSLIYFQQYIKGQISFIRKDNLLIIQTMEFHENPEYPHMMWTMCFSQNLLIYFHLKVSHYIRYIHSIFLHWHEILNHNLFNDEMSAFSNHLIKRIFIFIRKRNLLVVFQDFQLRKQSSGISFDLRRQDSKDLIQRKCFF